MVTVALAWMDDSYECGFSRPRWEIFLLTHPSSVFFVVSFRFQGCENEIHGILLFDKPQGDGSRPLLLLAVDT